MKKLFKLIILLTLLSACSITPELIPTATSAEDNQYVEEFEIHIGHINLSYEISDVDAPISKWIIFDNNSMSISSVGKEGQLPCGTNIELTIDNIEIGKDISSINFLSSENLNLIEDNISINENNVKVRLVFVGECPKNSLDNSEEISKFLLIIDREEFNIDLITEFFKPIYVPDLNLPMNVDQMINALYFDNVHLEYKAETRPENYVRGPHLGDMIEIASDSINTIFPSTPIEITAPIDMELINLWGFDHRLICFNGFIGYLENGKEVFYSMYHIDSLAQDIRKKVADSTNLNEVELVVSENGFGNHVFHPNIRLNKGEVIGYFDHFESSEYWGTHIASQLHVNLTHTSPTDNLNPYKYAIDFSNQYLSQIFEEFSGIGFRFVLDEGFSEDGESFSESNPPETEDLLSYLPENAYIRKMDWRTYVVTQ